MPRSSPWTALCLMLAFVVAACTSDPDADSDSRGGAEDATSGATSDASDASTPSASPAGPPPTTGPGELDRWFDATFTGTEFTLGAQREATASYTSYDATYRSEGLLITGVVNVPVGDGPFPAVVLAHGYVDPAVYVSGQGMTRERTQLATDGFLAFHIDYRGHAGSDADPDPVGTQRFGYAVDIINAVGALRASDAVPVDPERVAVFGRSMGGGSVLEALEMSPGFADAAVIYSSISSNAADNQQQFDGAGFWADLAAEVGTPAENPAYYEAASTRGHFDRIADPLLMIHGTRDTECPPAWADATYEALVAVGADVQIEWYDDAHAFDASFGASITAIEEFLNAQFAG